MKTINLILVGILLSFFGIWTIAYNIENGDENAISMYFVVYGIGAIGLGIINGIFLKLMELKTEKLIFKISLGILPIVILLGFLFVGNFRIEFIGKFGLIGIGITNLIWISKKILNEKEKASV